MQREQSLTILLTRISLDHPESSYARFSPRRFFRGFRSAAYNKLISSPVNHFCVDLAISLDQYATEGLDNKPLSVFYQRSPDFLFRKSWYFQPFVFLWHLGEKQAHNTTDPLLCITINIMVFPDIHPLIYGSGKVPVKFSKLPR
ncbi:hypothetical protein XENORESO_021806 [Xenotaenia resolanae]|uniref:Maturase K n=1 Tax=Xenotaenia resolanae TaxID=208358 RepID=A0ABV0WQH3_9TELE